MNPEIEIRRNGDLYCRICAKQLSRYKEAVRDRHVSNDQRRIRLVLDKFERRRKAS